MICRYTIPEIPPSNNLYIGRNARWQYRAEKKRWNDLVAVHCRPKPDRPITGTVRITYFFPDRRRRDPDNYSGKMILDGLTQARIIQDDCFEKIRLELAGGYDKNNPRCEIEVTDAQD